METFESTRAKLLHKSASRKAKLKQAFPDPRSYSSFMGVFSSATGVAVACPTLSASLSEASVDCPETS